MDAAATRTNVAPDDLVADLPGSEEITASSGSNFILSFTSLTPERQRAMSIFYAYCRVIDDVADSTELPLEEKRRQLNGWRREIAAAYRNEARTPLGREMAEIIRTYSIPPEPLEELLLGVEADLVQLRQPDFPALEKYCYRVASCVGLVCIEIFGYREAITKEYAVALGMAFQLTNILRDVKKDASFGRIYLPQDELARFGVTEEEIFAGTWSPRMRKLCLFQYHRAWHYFEKSWRLLSPTDRPNLVAAEIMREVYQSILVKIRRHDYNVFARETRLNKFEKVRAGLRARKREKALTHVPPPPKKVIVIGGGFAGVATSLELARLGHQVTLLETRNGLGGRAHSFRDAKTGAVLDNGQHVLMGCYHRTLHWIEELGVSDRLWRPATLEVPYRSNRGASVLHAPEWLPGSLGLLGAMLGFDELGGWDRLSAIALSARLKLGHRPAPDETAAVWLRRWSQTDNAVRAVWEPLCLAALNEPLASASAELLATVIERALLGSTRDAQIVISRVGLTELYDEEFTQYMSMCEGEVRLQTQVTALKFEGGRCAGVTTAAGETLVADQYVSALPWSALQALLPAEAKLNADCGAFHNSAIISLHLWLDYVVFDEPFLGLLDSPLHWVFNRGAVALAGEGGSAPGYLHSFIISGANELADLSSTELEKLAMSELQRLVPRAREAKVLHRLIYKARAATFAATPEAQRHRPNTATPWSNFWLAGDWTNTGLPGTIEGAVVSGESAAAAVDAAV